jgi:hypothetical protein
MGPPFVVIVYPPLSFGQQLANALILHAPHNGVLDFSNHPFGRPIVSGGASPTHTGNEVLADERIYYSVTAVLAALVGMPDHMLQVGPHLFWYPVQGSNN